MTANVKCLASELEQFYFHSGHKNYQHSPHVQNSGDQLFLARTILLPLQISVNIFHTDGDLLYNAIPDPPFVF